MKTAMYILISVNYNCFIYALFLFYYESKTSNLLTITISTHLQC